MDRIVIEKIELKNYRQYKDNTLSFPNKDHKMLHVLIAKNGTGKTTLLNAITWCLYGEEMHLRRTGVTLPILNANVFGNARPGETYDVSVTLTISTVDKMIEFKRLQSFSIGKDSSGANTAIEDEGHFEFRASITILGGTTNTDIKRGEEADAIVKQYFDKDIREFYFFDGEKLGEFFDEEKSDDIRKSILNISQVALLSSCISHIDATKTGIRRNISKDIPDMKTLLDQKDKFENSLETAKNNLQMVKERAAEEGRIISACDKAAKSIAPVGALQRERKDKEGLLNTLVKEQDELSARKKYFICRYLTLLNLYPRIKKVYEYISEQRAEDNFPPNIDIRWLQGLLEADSENCPICNNHLTKESRRHIQEYIDQTVFSTETAMYLREISSELERLMAEAENFPQEKDEIEELLDKNTRDIKDCGERLDEISNLLRGYDLSEAEINKKIRDNEDKRAKAVKKQAEQNQAIGALKAIIEDGENQLQEIEDQIQDTERTTAVNYDTQRQIELFDILREAAETVKENIMSGMREEIEPTTWEYFNSMIWKERTFGAIHLGEDYTISVLSLDNKEMTGSLSATEEMALAYAYTLAIHKASGRNCPLVIDSPLGRVSDDNREKMARALFEVSNSKQIIMLFTPDEYSEPVQKIYGKNVSVINLELSEDESYVEGVGQ